MKSIDLQYGRDGLTVDVPFNDITVLKPQFVPGLPDEEGEFLAAVRNPIAAAPIADQIKASDKIAVVIADITRALPSDRLLTWLFAELKHVPAENFTIIIGTGTHRACTPEEIKLMVGHDIAHNYRVINHNAYDDETMETVGHLQGHHGQVKLNKEYVQADKRIIVGFIEPHFMAGFSGGYKAVFPGIAGLQAILHYHRAEVIGHPNSTWGVTEDNPTLEQIRHYGSIIPIDFCINITLNHKQEITRYFCGEVEAAHQEGCAFAKQTAMVACDQPFSLVMTTNSGFPLDQNLYQTVKGMCAAAEIVTEGGLIVTAARCNDGFPDHGNFTQLLRDHDSPQAILDTVYTPGFHMLDQWQAQKLAQVQRKADVALYSEIAAKEIRGVRLEPIDDLNQYLQDKCEALGADTPVAVLPEGPMTIPYLD